MEYNFVVTGWNCELYAKKCIESILAQNGNFDFNIFVFDDGSTDDTYSVLDNYSHMDNVFVHKNDYNMGAAYCRYIAIHTSLIKPESVCLLIGLDDTIAPNMLEVIDAEYQKGAQVTYGNWVNHPGHLNTIREYPDKAFKDREFHNYGFFSTAVNTFKARLFKSIPASDWIIDGKWIMNCTEVPTMWGVMDRAKFGTVIAIKEPIYIYNNENPRNTYFRFGNKDKARISKEIIKRRLEQ